MTSSEPQHGGEALSPRKPIVDSAPAAISRTPLLPTILRLNQSLSAGSSTARDHLRGFILGVISGEAGHDESWLKFFVVGVERHLQDRLGTKTRIFSADDQWLVDQVQNLNWHVKYKQTAELCDCLRETLEKFGDPLLMLWAEAAARLIDGEGREYAAKLRGGNAK